MSSQRRSSRRRSAVGEIALRLTQGWFVVAVLSIVFLNGITPDKAGFQLHPNYLFLVATALIPAAAWVWYFYVQDRQKEAGKSLRELQALSPDAFEEWVAARFRDMSYMAKVTGSHSTGGDHGVDIIADKPGEKAVIQCKNWNAWQVGEPQVRDLYGAMHHYRADKAYLVTTGFVSHPARNWITGKPIEIWDGEYLVRLSKQMASRTRKIKESAPVVEPAVADDVDERNTPSVAETVVKTDAISPSCPKCGSALVERRNGRTGEPFLACPRFPACRHTQPLAS